MTVAAAIAERVLMNIIVGMAVDTLVCRIAKRFVIIVT
jgi:endonuclease III